MVRWTLLAIHIIMQPTACTSPDINYRGSEECYMTTIPSAWELNVHEHLGMAGLQPTFEAAFLSMKKDLSHLHSLCLSLCLPPSPSLSPPSLYSLSLSLSRSFPTLNLLFKHHLLISWYFITFRAVLFLQIGPSKPTTASLPLHQCRPLGPTEVLSFGGLYRPPPLERL